MASNVHAVPFSAVRALRAAAWFGAAGVTLSAIKLVTDVRIGCPWLALTGTFCPLCGATTMGSRLLVGDIAGAWANNPFVLVLLGLGLLAVIAWTVEVAGGPALRPPRALRSPALWWSILGAAALAFMIWRNL
ncbi:MAG: DUF2752 domain-containing protein [Propionicimonas sp.]